MHVREPAVAGTFYPSDPHILRRQIDDLLAQAGPRRGEEPEARSPKAVIVPHAGYVYSGPIAASAYARLARLRGRVKRVVLLGPAHRVAVRGLALLPLDAMSTPLGLVPIDREGAESLRDLPQVISNEAAHRLEHSLEVQLPFLQATLGDFSVLPLVVGDASDAEVAEVLERLWDGPETLFVVSSDLSHYYDDETARRLDGETCRAIERFDAEALDWESACGRVPVRGLLRVARERGLEIETLDLRNSGDTAGPRDSVVGYGAWALSSARPTRTARGAGTETQAAAVVDPSGSDASLDAALLSVAKRSIVHGLRTGGPLPVDPAVFAEPLRRPGACFVTLRRDTGELRGCVGSLEPLRALVEDVAWNAWAAACDGRFEPLQAFELPSIRVHVSVLEPAVRLDATSREDLLRQLRPGRDGLILEDRGRRATFLPQVWESVAAPADFVGLLWQKAGLRPDHWSPTTRAWRYEARSIEEA